MAALSAGEGSSIIGTVFLFKKKLCQKDPKLEWICFISYTLSPRGRNASTFVCAFGHK